MREMWTYCSGAHLRRTRSPAGCRKLCLPARTLCFWDTRRSLYHTDLMEVKGMSGVVVVLGVQEWLGRNKEWCDGGKEIVVLLATRLYITNHAAAATTTTVSNLATTLIIIMFGTYCTARR